MVKFAFWLLPEERKMLKTIAVNRDTDMRVLLVAAIRQMAREDGFLPSDRAKTESTDNA